jgi:hypothetical protein
MTQDVNVPAEMSQDGEAKKKPYTRPVLVEIGATKDVVQSYYPYNPNDAYARYYVYRS